MTRTAILCLIILYSFQLFGQTDKELFVVANTAYQNENYTEAISVYESILSNDVASPELFHNLGNAYYKSNQKGKAMLAYERGLLLNPNDASINADREVVKENIESDIFEVPPFAPLRYWRSFTRLLSPNFWVILQLLGLGFIIYYYSQKWIKPYKAIPSWMNILKNVSTITVICSTLALLSLWHRKHNTIEAIVLADTQLYIGPDERSGEVNPIPEGEKVAILESFDDWWKVQLLNLEEGYVKKSIAEKI